VLPQPVNPAHDAGIDPVTGLHKMSYIAGVGTQEYASINLPAVIAVVLGLAGCMAMIWAWLIVIPLAGLACGIAGLIQIRNSNGTQTGRMTAWIGVVLAGLFVVIVGGQKLIEERQLSIEGQKISALCQQWGQDIVSGDFKAAYGLYSDRFTDKIPFDEFKQHMMFLQANPYSGPMVHADWNGLAQFDSESETGVITASAMVRLDFKNGGIDRWNTFFRLVNGQWKIDAMPEEFTEQRTPR
jgi:hypothetical protein